ncbi:hypothetical protein JCM5350_004762 [Sporobolomyces pararoseus]
MISLRPVIVGLLISILYLPVRHVYSILNFHLSSLPEPFSDPEFVSTTSSLSSSRSPLRQQVRTTTIFSNSNQTIGTSFDQSDYDRFAFCEDAIVYKLEGVEKEVGILSCDPTRWEWNTVMGTLVNPRAGKGALWVLDPVETGGGEQLKRIKLDWNENSFLEEDFHPLGIDIYHRSSPIDSDTLFVINHRGSNYFSRSSTGVVPLFSTATFSISDLSLTLPLLSNSNAVVSSTAFYLVQGHSSNPLASSCLKKTLGSFVTLSLAIRS